MVIESDKHVCMVFVTDNGFYFEVIQGTCTRKKFNGAKVKLEWNPNDYNWGFKEGTALRFWPCRLEHEGLQNFQDFWFTLESG